MELPELSLAPTEMVFHKRRSTASSMELVESNASRKRKLFQDYDHLMKTTTGTGPSVQTSVDLQIKDPLPLDWEQCLDLESGKMYYLNRKTARKSWNWPMDQQPVNLELNISTLSDSSANDQDQRFSRSSNTIQEAKNKQQYSSGSSNMVALACLNCHLLVILSKSSPSCPNCKYVHSLPTSNFQPTLQNG